MSVQRIEITLEPAPRSYPIFVGPNALAESLGQIKAYCPRRVLPVITDETVAELHLETLQQALASAEIQICPLILPAQGEGQKSFAGLERVCDFLLEQNISRKDVVVAFGGGVIGDLTGLAAAITKRGLGCIQIPTTLLSQIDSSVGGKTAINTAIGKNMVGVFHQPKLVVADTNWLQSLDARQWRAGYAEMLKMACLSDQNFFDFLQEAGPKMQAGDADLLTKAIARSVQAKADIVAKDELEHGPRALLNLGHTFGHALESEAPGKIIHGEAVAVGMDLAFGLSVQLGFCAPKDHAQVQQHLAKMNLPNQLKNAPGGPYRAKRIL